MTPNALILKIKLSMIMVSKTKKKSEKEIFIENLDNTMNKLTKDYLRNIVTLKAAWDHLYNKVIPELERISEDLLNKSQEYKEKFEESKKLERPVESYMTSSMMYLKLKIQTEQHLKDSREYMNNLSYTIDNLEAEFKCKIEELRLMKSYKNMSFSLSPETNKESEEKIKNIQNYINSQIQEFKIRQEVDEILSGNNNIEYEKLLELYENL